MNALNPTYIISLREAVTELNDGCATLLESTDSNPAHGSQADRGLAQSPQCESIETVISITQFLNEFSSEHLSTFVKILNEPIEPLAACTCVRSMLESCAIAAWLVDPDIEDKERIARQFAHRFQGLDQQLKFGRVAGFDLATLNAI